MTTATIYYPSDDATADLNKDGYICVFRALHDGSNRVEALGLVYPEQIVWC
ncbi:hypothetical protein PBR31_00064 [Xanthomonas phage PBR31]|uniref:Uncharacterized protein n=1 Tax=Xanthomonas phage PPDBI TaxID=2723911 RepID=A0A6H0X629_9CAUD|nr:hypothetical protein [Ralstonia pickettii]NYS09349.1 hypothetical protein [Ralstonia pickettii]QIN95375.1 hypothetical protein PBR31_00064 [Xanthomonas phage PBR31]QIW89423.1 hypothetical protein PPDBI_00064 [Xanthomonas phage PPDBI]